jgi:Trk K+ transport system NAD-binding subunit
VVGLGNTGYRIVQLLLDSGVEVAAVELSERNHFIGLARRQGVPVLVADGRYRDSLLALSVKGARAIIAATNDDLANVESALVARELNPQARIVARLFDQDLASRAQSQLRINACHWVSGLAAPAFVAAAMSEGMLNTMEHAGRLWLVGEVTVLPASSLDGMATQALEDRALHFLAVRNPQSTCWRPSCPDLLAAGQDLLVASSRDGRERLLVLRASQQHAVQRA